MQEAAAHQPGQLRQLPHPGTSLFDQLAQQGGSLCDALPSSSGQGGSGAEGSWRSFDKASKSPFCLFTSPAEAGQPPYCAGKGTFPFPIDEVVSAMVVNMPGNSPRWDRTCRGVEVLEKWSESEWLYRYKIDPGFPLSPRDMVYYEGWRTLPNGQVINVSASLDGSYAAACPLPRGWVRMAILLHYKRFTPTQEGQTLYETIQQMDLKGWLPSALVTGGVTRGLRTEFEGFTRIMEEDRKKGAAAQQGKS